MKWYLLLTLSLVLVVAYGCGTPVHVTPGSEAVEIVDVSQMTGDRGDDCERLGDVTAQVGPDPEVDEGVELAAAEVEARNRAHDVGATHVAVERQRTFECNSRGKVDSDGGRSCYELPATAYDCDG